MKRRTDIKIPPRTMIGKIIFRAQQAWRKFRGKDVYVGITVRGDSMDFKSKSPEDAVRDRKS